MKRSLQPPGKWVAQVRQSQHLARSPASRISETRPTPRARLEHKAGPGLAAHTMTSRFAAQSSSSESISGDQEAEACEACKGARPLQSLAQLHFHSAKLHFHAIGCDVPVGKGPCFEFNLPASLGWRRELPNGEGIVAGLV